MYILLNTEKCLIYATAQSRNTLESVRRTFHLHDADIVSAFDVIGSDTTLIDDKEAWHVAMNPETETLLYTSRISDPTMLKWWQGETLKTTWEDGLFHCYVLAGSEHIAVRVAREKLKEEV